MEEICPTFLEITPYISRARLASLNTSYALETSIDF